MFVNEVSILSNFSILEPGGTFDDPSDPPAQLDVQFKDDLIKFSIQNIAHPRGKIVKKAKRSFNLGNLVELMANGLGDASEAINCDKTYGYSVRWWNADVANEWMDELLILGRVFPELAKTLLPLPVTDVRRLRERWGGSLLKGVNKLLLLAHGFEWVEELNQTNFNLEQLAQFVGVSDPMDIDEIGARLQALDHKDIVLPSDWERRHVQGRKRIPPLKPITLDEISACTSKNDLIAMLSMPGPSRLDSFMLALHRWIEFGLGRETDSRGMENNIALM